MSAKCAKAEYLTQEMLLPHIESRLLELGDDVTAAQRRKLAVLLEKNAQFLTKKDYLKHSSLFDYRGKVDGVVNHFADQGLQYDAYVQACTKRHQLLLLMPETVIKNVDQMIERFQTHGLSHKDYLSACLKQPQLFYQSADTLAKNINQMVAQFAAEGLTHKAYITACLHQPTLFYQSPGTLEKNINDMAEAFKEDGITRQTYLDACLKQPSLIPLTASHIAQNVQDFVTEFEQDGLQRGAYLRACMIQPQLFYQAPKTLAGNLRHVMDAFEAQGLSREQYVQACLKQPTLFYSKPQTVIRHMQLMMAMVDLDLVPQGTAEKPYQPLFDAVMATPVKLTWGDENLILRMDYMMRSPKKFEQFGVLHRNKGQIMQLYQENIGGDFNLSDAHPVLKQELRKRALWPQDVAL